MAVKTSQRMRLGAAGISAPNSTISALWILVGLELAAIAGLRRYFRKHHGG